MQPQYPVNPPPGGYPVQGYPLTQQHGPQSHSQAPPLGMPPPPHQTPPGYPPYSPPGSYQSYGASNAMSHVPPSHGQPPRPPPSAAMASPPGGYPQPAAAMAGHYAAPSSGGYPPPPPPQPQGHPPLVSPTPPAGYPAPHVNSARPAPIQHPYPTSAQPPLPSPPGAPFASGGAAPPLRPSYSGSSQYQAPPVSAPKISSAQMPSVVAVQEADQARFSATGASPFFRASMISDMLPPLPTTDIPIFDDGNCSSRFMRPTMYHLPASEDLATSSKIPLAMVIQPFAKQHPQEHPVPVVDFGEKGPIRCNRCRAYINLFVRFVRGGRQYECNICSMINDVPDEYFCNLDASGRRADCNQRPELVCASVDFVASKEYIMRSPSPPSLLFAIDVTRNAVQNGAFVSSLSVIRKFIEEHVQNPHNRRYSKMAIVTFDKNIHVYDLRAAEPQILVMSDITDPFVPLHDGLFFDPVSASEQALALLDRLPSMFSESRVIDSCFGAVAAFSLEALRSRGGRAAIFHSTISSIGTGVLRNRETSATPPADKVNPLYIPQTDFYSKLGAQAASYGVSFVLVSTPATFIDLATIGKLASATNGQILHYPKFGSDLSGRALIEDVFCALTKPFVFDCVLRVRSGSALQTGEYMGNFSTLNQTDYQFSAFDCDQTFTVTFLYDAKLSENEIVSFQCAVLYTSCEGQRRIRLHNLALKVTSAMSNIFRMADLEAIIQFFCKRAIHQASSMSLQGVVNHFHVRGAQLLAAYRKFCAQNMPAGQLVLPESLKLLPIYCLAFSKTMAFSQGLQMMDSRVASMVEIMSMSQSQLPVYLYPRLVALHRLSEQAPGEGGEEGEPPALRLSHEFIEPHGLYLLENGHRILIWIGSMVDPEILSRIFGVAQVVALQTVNLDCLPEMNNPLSIQARRLVSKIHEKHAKFIPIKVIRQSLDPAEIEWQCALVEDGQPSWGPSYVDFLCRLHGQITHEMSSSSLAEKTALLSFLQ